jgi:hypothetical protein
MATHHPLTRHARATDTAPPTSHPRWVMATLVADALVAVAIGIAIVGAPRSFIDSVGEPTADLLSETRAPGGAILAIGAFITMAVIRRRRLGAAAAMGALTYLGYGLSRVLGMVVDGVPSGTIVAATLVELALGVASLAIVRRGSRLPW